MPEENEKDLIDIPGDVKDQLTFVTIHTVEDLIKETLGLELPKPEVLRMGTLPGEKMPHGQTLESFKPVTTSTCC